MPPVPYAVANDSANALLDRAMGRPPVHVDMGNKGGFEPLIRTPASSR